MNKAVITLALLALVSTTAHATVYQQSQLQKIQRGENLIMNNQVVTGKWTDKKNKDGSYDSYLDGKYVGRVRTGTMGVNGKTKYNK